ncbi:dehydrogenase [Clostridia bacterium]|nr:dehydrogenase [Clostridia bacterium]
MSKVDSTNVMKDGVAWLGASQVKEMDKVEIKRPDCSKATPRIEKLRELYLTANRYLDIERCRTFYNFFYKSDKAKGEPAIVANAMMFAEYLKERTIYIEEGQLIAGSFGKCQRATLMYPESIGKEMMAEYRKLPTRRIDAFDITPEELDELDFMLNDMNRDSIRKLTFASLEPEEKALFLKDPDNDPVTLSKIFTIDIAIQGPGGHINPDYQTVIEVGLDSIRQKARLRLEQARAENDQRGIDFLRAAIITIDGFEQFALRYSALCKELAAKEADPVRKDELLKMAGICARVPMQPARTFHEACQCVWFLFVGIQDEALEKCFSVGRFDQFTYPLYKKDIENGVITPEQGQDILDCLFMKYPETNYINSDANQTAAGFSVQQQFIVGGQTPDGKDATNDVSYMLLQASMDTRLGQPSVSLRMWDGTPDSLYRKACELARLGTGHPSFFCDETIVPSLLNKGVLLEDARDYSAVGCSGVQCTRKDKGGHNAGYMNMATCLEFVMYNGYWPLGKNQKSIKTGDPRDFTSFDQVMDAFQAQIGHLLEIYTKTTVKIEDIIRKLCPSPFLSCFVQDCITRARDRTDGGAVYNFGMTSRAVGLATVADSLAALKKLVFEDKSVTMDEMITAMQDDFVGHDDIKALIAKCPKYGNDDDYVDNIAREVTRIYSDEQDRYRSLFGGRFNPGFSTISANVFCGAIVSALPDGRSAWTPISDGISPSHHTEKNGPTAVALSTAKLYHEGLSGGSILNLRFSPLTVANESGLDALVSFVKGMQKAHIWHAQFNMVDVDTLKEAQVNPNKYPDLLVRVAGYSTFFTGLPEILQDDIIDRSIYSLT